MTAFQGANSKLLLYSYAVYDPRAPDVFQKQLVTIEDESGDVVTNGFRVGRQSNPNPDSRSYVVSNLFLSNLTHEEIALEGAMLIDTFFEVATRMFLLGVQTALVGLVMRIRHWSMATGSSMREANLAASGLSFD